MSATVVALLDEVLEDSNLIDPNDAEYEPERERCLRALIRVWRKVWTDRPWWFVFSQGSVTIPDAQGYVALPSDFGEFTIHGGAFRSLDGCPMVPRSESYIEGLKNIPGVRVANPLEYAVYGQDSSTKAPRIQTALNSGAAVVKLIYRMRPPTLDETSNSANVLKVPETWHDAVVIPMTKAEIRAPKADALWKKYNEDAMAGLKKMRCEVRSRREGGDQMPSFGGRRSM